MFLFSSAFLYVHIALTRLLHNGQKFSRNNFYKGVQLCFEIWLFEQNFYQCVTAYLVRKWTNHTTLAHLKRFQPCLNPFGATCYGLGKNISVHKIGILQIFVTNKLFESSFRRFSFFRIAVNTSQTKKSSAEIFFVCGKFFSFENFSDFEFFFKNFCVRPKIFLFVTNIFCLFLHLFFFGKKIENGLKCL